MSKLQNNYTTVEQSKRLLELGVPEWTADCYNTTKHIGKIPEGATYKDVWQMSIWRDKNDNHIEMYPCWSVGRLIEIYGFGTNQYIGNIWYRNPMECIIADIEIAIENGEMDFSKLKE